MEIPIVIASHNRAKTITTHKKVTNSIICIAESQAGLYREYCPDTEIICHSDNVLGISAKRQWIFEKFGNSFQLDDDLAYCKRIYVPPGETEKMTPQETYNLIQATYKTARAMGVKLWGFNTSGKPYTFSAMEPIQLSGYVNTCAFGLIEGGKLYFRPEMACNEDYWLSGLNAYCNRKILRDNRFYFHYGETWTGSGGLAGARNIAVLENILLDLQKIFGDDVICKRKSGTKNHEFQMNFKVPF
jgi:hypothetical protein